MILMELYIKVLRNNLDKSTSRKFEDEKGTSLLLYMSNLYGPCQPHLQFYQLQESPSKGA